MNKNILAFRKSSSHQKTVKHSVTCSGIGTHTGLTSSLTLRPAPQNTGIIFIRTDLKTHPKIPALSTSILNGHYASKIGNSSLESVSTIEHLMATLSAFSIDNVFVDVDGPEIPIMDGSALPFIDLLEKAGTVFQKASRKFLKICRPVEVQENGRIARLTPSSGFSIECDLTFRPEARFSDQHFFYTHTLENFRTHIADARTFGFFEDAQLLYQKGLALGASLSNSVVFQNGKPMNEEGLRHADECVRHKVLDVLGDLMLTGYPIKGHFYGHSSGHALNHQLILKLLKDSTLWRIEEESTERAKTSFSPVSHTQHVAFSPS